LFDTINVSPSSYIFTSVTQEAKKLEYYDEKKRICDLKLFHPFFKLIELHTDLNERVERSLNSEISKKTTLIF
jgi:phosphatidylinositol-4,5-bisphosphate 3-kinase